MKHSELLRQSVEKLYHPKENRKGNLFICYALGTSLEAYEIRDLIGRRLGEHSSVSSYLNAELKVPLQEIVTKRGKPTAKVQEYRAAWMLELAREYEAKGM